jgi:hypothetical protein
MNNLIASEQNSYFDIQVQVQRGLKFIAKQRKLRTAVASDPGRNCRAILLALIALGEDDAMALYAELADFADFEFGDVCDDLIGHNGENIRRLIEQVKGTLG